MAEGYRKQWLAGVESKGNPDKLSEEEKEFLADVYASFELGRQRAHYKAWKKGKVFYNYKGKQYIVMDKQVVQHRADQLNEQAKINSVANKIDD